MPRSTTHVPTTEVARTARKPANSALRMNSLAVKGSIHQSTGLVRNGHGELDSNTVSRGRRR